jgi:hypothetical protein
LTHSTSTPSGCARLARPTSAILSVRLVGSPSGQTGECAFTTTAGKTLAYARLGTSARQVEGTATLRQPTRLHLSCGVGYFQPSGRPVVGHAGTRIRVDAATCIAGTELGWSADRTATANHALVAVMANPAR